MDWRILHALFYIAFSVRMSPFAEGLVGQPTSSVLWSSGVFGCPRGLVVVEEAYYEAPESAVCASDCRSGPEGKGKNCYFSGSKCVQGLAPTEVAAIYDVCNPLSAPSSCNLTQGNLPASLTVGYSCMTGDIFDPYNKIFSWKSTSVTFALGYRSDVTSDVITQCRFKSDAENPDIKVTYLKPFAAADHADASNVSTDSDDVIFRFHDGSWNLGESYYPRWRKVQEKAFSVTFDVKASSDRTRPFWVMLQDSGDRIEVICEPLHRTPAPFTTKPLETTQEVTSATVTSLPREAPKPGYSLKDELPAAFAGAGVVVAVVVVPVSVFCLCRWRRRRNGAARSEHYESMLAEPAVVYSSAGPGTCIINSPGADSAQRANRALPAPPSCSTNQHRQPSAGHSNHLPPGSALSNGAYGFGGYVDMGGTGNNLSPDDTGGGSSTTAAARDRDSESYLTPVSVLKKLRGQNEATQGHVTHDVKPEARKRGCPSCRSSRTDYVECFCEEEGGREKRKGSSAVLTENEYSEISACASCE